jgi:hypothetical protein
MEKSKDQDRSKGAMEQDQQNHGGNTCRSPKLDRARLAPREALHSQSRTRIGGSSQRSISMEWC